MNVIILGVIVHVAPAALIYSDTDRGSKSILALSRVVSFFSAFPAPTDTLIAPRFETCEPRSAQLPLLPSASSPPPLLC